MNRDPESSNSDSNLESASSESASLAVNAAVKNQGSTTVPDWQQLAKEWADRNRDDDLVKQFKGTAPTATAETKVEVSWDQMLKDIEEIVREAQETFDAMQQIEVETLEMINTAKVRDEQYQETIRQLQSDAESLRRELTGKLDAMTYEYNKFRSDAQQQQRSTQQEALAVQQRLQSEIEDFRQKLNQQIQTATQEAEKAQQFMKQRLALEQELADFKAESSKKMQYLKSGYEHELDMRFKDLRKAQEHLRWLQEDGQRRVDQAIQEGEQKLDREWVDYTYSLIEKTEELFELQNELDAADSSLQQQDERIAQLQSENARIMSLAQGTWDLINKIEQIGVEGGVATLAPIGHLPSLADIQIKVAGMINNLQTKDVQYRVTIQRLENDLKEKEKEYSLKLEHLADEYQKYKFDTHNQHMAAMQSMKDTQEELQLQIDYLQTMLQEQVDLTKKEASRAEEFLKKRLDVERELSVSMRESTAKINELDGMYTAERDGRAEDRKAAIEALEEQFRIGRKWARDERRKGQAEVDKVTAEVKSEMKRNKETLRERRKVLTILTAGVIVSVVAAPKIQDFDLPLARQQISNLWDRARKTTAKTKTKFKEEQLSGTIPGGIIQPVAEKSESSANPLADKAKTASEPVVENSKTPAKSVAEKIKSLFKAAPDSKRGSKSASDDIPWGEYGAEWFEANK